MARQGCGRKLGWVVLALVIAASSLPRAQRPECADTALAVAEDGTLVTMLACVETGPLADLEIGFIRTVAGSGLGGWSGDGGPAVAATLNLPHGVAIDPAGTIYIADSGNHVVRRVDALTGIVTTIAGAGVPGFAGDDGPATEALLNDPRRVAVDAAGHVFVADINNARIRRIDGETGLITTVAGGATESGEHINAIEAHLLAIGSIAFDRAGSLFVAETGRNRIRRIVPGGDGLVTGEAGEVISTVAGGIQGFSGDGGPASSARFSAPEDLAFDGPGDLYVADRLNHRIRRIAAGTDGLVDGDPDEVISTMAGGGVGDGTGVPAVSVALNLPRGVVADLAGNVFISEAGALRVRRVDAATGIITTVAGGGTVAGEDILGTNLQLGNPRGLAVDTEGNLFIAEQGRHRVRGLRQWPAAFSYSLVTPPAHGNASIDGDGTLTYSPHPNFAGIDSLSFRAASAGGTAGNVATVSITVQPINDPPHANAGPDRPGTIGVPIQLDGSGSSDPDGTPLAYSWRFVLKPVGSLAALQNPDSATSTFVPDVADGYVVELTVTDSSGATAVDTVSLKIRGLFISTFTPSTSGNGGHVDMTVRGGAFAPGVRVFLAETNLEGVVGYTAPDELHVRFDLRQQSAGSYTLRVINPDGSSADARDQFVIHQSPAVTSIHPTIGAGVTTIALQGVGFVEGATTFTLTRSGQAPLTPTDVVATTTTVRGTFNLSGAVPGLWDVVVDSPNEPAVVLTGAFEVQSVPSPALGVAVLSQAYLRAPFKVSVRVQNTGNGDAINVPLWIRVQGPGVWELNQHEASAGATLGYAALRRGLSRPPVPAGEDPAVAAAIEYGNASPVTLGTPDSNYQQSDGDGQLLIPVMLRRIPPGTAQTIDLGFNVHGAVLGRWSVRAWTNPPLASWVSSPASACTQKVTARLGCSSSLSTALAMLSQGGAPSGIGFWAQVAEACTQLSLPAPTAIARAIDVNTLLGADSESSCAPSRVHLTDRLARFDVIGSDDPNDKGGAHGSGERRDVDGSQPLPYTIRFENKKEATAPAQEVVITDQLDPALVDLSTFELGPISFGDRRLDPEPGSRAYAADVDLRPARDVLLRINAGLDTQTGIVTWRFLSLDPATGEPHTDALAGFLPPNVAPPEGDGSVQFSVTPRASLSTGTEIRNLASIVFDTNAAIVTPEWSNRLDNSPPISQVQALAARQDSTSFTVEWSGTDEGSGIREFDVFASRNGAPFELWVRTAETSATFTGSIGDSYAFFTVARDDAELVESPPVAADAFTRVDLDPPVADAGPDQLVNAGAVAQLDGTGSTDPDGSAIAFAWHLLTTPDGSRASLMNATSANPTFVPDVAGTYVVELTVTDAAGLTATDAVTITARGAVDQILDLLALIRGMPLHPVVKAYLTAVLEDAISRPRTVEVLCDGLALLIRYVEGRAGRTIPLALATQLVADATRISIVLGCR